MRVIRWEVCWTDEACRPIESMVLLNVDPKLQKEPGRQCLRGDRLPLVYRQRGRIEPSSVALVSLALVLASKHH